MVIEPGILASFTFEVDVRDNISVAVLIKVYAPSFEAATSVAAEWMAREYGSAGPKCIDSRIIRDDTNIPNSPVH
jgi:hypothetical protein